MGILSLLLWPWRAQEEILDRFSVGWSFENPFAVRSESCERIRAPVNSGLSILRFRLQGQVFQ